MSDMEYGWGEWKEGWWEIDMGGKVCLRKGGVGIEFEKGVWLGEHDGSFLVR